MHLSILYRGPLSSCNSSCPYCPFAKHRESDAEHAADDAALDRFLGWVEGRHQDQVAVFFTPWGEALIRKRYQEALVRLTNMGHVTKAAIQTNLSSSLDWVERCDKRKLGIWATFHPGEVAQERFVQKCLQLDRTGVPFSVGVVGLKEHMDAIQSLRQELPAHIYLWINAYKREPAYYTAVELEQFTRIDPLFPLNTVRHPSQGRYCRCGHSVIAVDGEGTIRRCHFIRTPIGNLYEPGFEAALQPTPCTNQTCGCHIGYVHLPHLGLEELFGGGILERVPADGLSTDCADDPGPSISTIRL